MASDQCLHCFPLIHHFKTHQQVAKWTSSSFRIRRIIQRPRSLLIFGQSDYLIQFVDINSILNGKQCRSRSVGFFRIQLIWIYTVCKGRIYPSTAAGQGLISHGGKYGIHYKSNPFIPEFMKWAFPSPNLDTSIFAD